MLKINPLLMMDFYKSVHSDMIPEGMTKSVSYFTPRDSRIKRWPCVVMYGLQAFIKEYLIDTFQESFFNVPKEEIIRSYQETLTPALGDGVYHYEKIERLHDLGYLPIEILAMPEGTLVPIHVPLFSITNTHPDFAWLPQALESLISAELWYPMVCATVGWDYRRIVNKYYELTCDDDVPVRRALGNFDFRGDDGLDAALKAAGGWLLSFDNTATVPAIPYMKYMYNSDCAGYGAVSTEHFVMCSNYAVDGDEETFIRKMLTELYPHTSFSCVLDSYDYWNVIDNIIPKLHKEIMEHDGCMLMRGDSGNCVDVVTKTVFKLWAEFGGSINSKGYKVLDPHVKAIYGDSITIQRAESIFRVLQENGFAACNVSLGVGSFSMHCLEDNGKLNPFTRDTFGMAIKACYGEIDGKEYFIHKEPKEAGFKKSHKGCCVVHVNKNASWESSFVCIDHKTYREVKEDADNCMIPVFCDGKLVREYSLDTIRFLLHGDVSPSVTEMA